MTTGPTPAQLDALTAWERSGGSNAGAARMLGRSVQTIKNELLAFRRIERAETNHLLSQRYAEVISKRRLRRAA